MSTNKKHSFFTQNFRVNLPKQEDARLLQDFFATVPEDDSPDYEQASNLVINATRRVRFNSEDRGAQMNMARIKVQRLLEKHGMSLLSVGTNTRVLLLPG